MYSVVLLAGRAGCKDKQNEMLRVLVRKDDGKVRWCWPAEPEREGAPAKYSGAGIRCLLLVTSCRQIRMTVKSSTSCF